MPQYECITVDNEDRVTTVTLDRPRKRNATLARAEAVWVTYALLERPEDRTRRGTGPSVQPAHPRPGVAEAIRDPEGRPPMKIVAKAGEAAWRHCQDWGKGCTR